MPKKSKIETSTHFNEIVDLLIAGYSGRYVSDYLKDKYDEKISYVSLNKYKKDNLNVKAAVKQKILEKEKEKLEQKKKDAQRNGIETKATHEIQVKETLEIARDYRYNDIKKLDNLIEESEKININLESITDPYKRESLKLQMKKIGLDSMKLKYDMIDDDELNVNVNDDRIVGLSESLEKSRQKYLKEKENK